MTEDDERISRALQDLTIRQVPTGPVPLAQLLHRGRRARRLRTLTGTATGAGGLALVCAVTLALVPGPTPQAPPPLSAARSASTTPSAETPTATPPVSTPDRLLELLKSKLPTGLQLSNPWKLDRTSGFPIKQQAAAYTISNSTGTGTVRIDVSRATPSPNGKVRPQDCSIPGCTVTAQPDGSVLTLYLPPRAVGGEQDWRATLQRPDGTTVLAGAGNIPGPGSDRREPYPNPPLLTGAQLSALALDPAWHQAAAALPAP
ncbi:MULTISPECIES: hypothetical protein [unclassified Kitasatospora]|uniref:hypothetical protein n=1 Tax=unclassified Kitasatospora TaxID=2633591 RepID=UPI00070D7724|nr:MULTISPECIES: hypothetical protein [unclassified Kitasatospora]KQV18729.1 hypothetical protein ASC99_05890 [Kitasatospora sp. Root107]KRB74710.1 hypothetical protein ASE03_19825 [Kitasatospora sp. Root187]